MSSTEGPTVEELEERFRKLSSEELLGMLAPMQSLNLTGEALEAVRLVLAERGEPTESPVAARCLQCTAPLDLEAGLLVTEDRLLGEVLHWFAPYLPFAISPLTRFLADEGGPKRTVLSEWRSRRAARCRRCGLILFPGPVEGER